MNRLLTKLKAIDIRVQLGDNDELKIRGNKKNLTRDLIAELKSNKTALVELLRKLNAAQPLRDMAIKAQGLKLAPLSFAQQRLWFLSQMEHQTAQYNMPYALHLQGKLNPLALQYAFDQLLLRHHILRTTYQQKDGKPFQAIQPVSAFDLSVDDLTASGLNAHDPAVNLMLADEARKPFNLTVDYGLRAKLVKLVDNNNILLLTMHHIASDGGSLAILTAELNELYNRFDNHGVNAQSLAPLDHQYSDYAAWQHQLMKKGVMTQQLDFWRTNLEGISPVHSLPLDRPRPVAVAHHGANLSVKLDKQTLQGLYTLANKKGTTLFVVLQAAFSLLISRWSNEQDVLMGTPIGGRTHAELEPLIGLFVNTLLLRNQVQLTLTFDQLIDEAKGNIERAFANQLVPFDMLVNELNVERSLSFSPLTQIVFSLRNNDAATLDMNGLTIEGLDNQFDTLKFDLELAATEQDDGLLFIWNYSVELFNQSTIKRMADCLNHLLGEVVKQPNLLVSEINLLDDAHQQALEQLGTAELAHPPSTINTLIEQWAQKQPDALALRYDDKKVSYFELNRQANQLAHHIQAKGVKSSEVVAICAERSVQMVVAMLAVLKAGGTYVMLDSSYPDDRLEYMFDDSHAKLVLLDAANQARLSVAQSKVIPLHQAQSYQGFATVNLEMGHSQQNACVVYTSGSTGLPKGAPLPHQGIVRLVKATNFFDYTANDIVGQASNCAFDISMIEIWGALCNGAQLCYISRETLLDATHFSDFIAQQQISMLFVTTALFNQMSALAPQCFSSLKTLGFGGEAADLNAINRVIEHGKPARMINAYGPAENSCASTVYEIKSRLDDSIPIGSAIEGSYHYVLDSAGHQVPMGVVGELCVGGPALATGYLNKADISAAKFVGDTIRNDGSKIYKTGDMVRYRFDGELEFVGRADDQVKIRGFRIELGEIETKLSAQPQIKEAVVLVDVQGSEKFIVAYFKAAVDEDSVQLISQLKKQLKQILPEFMVPNVFVEVGSFKLTANGKIDKKALPKADRQAQQVYVAPQTSTEQALANMWQSLLNLENISATANFFESGGHSLLATRLISSIETELNCDITVKSLFEMPMLNELAAFIDSQQKAQQNAQKKTPIIAVSRELPILPSFGQQRLWFIDQLGGGVANAQYNTTLALRAKGSLDLHRLEQAINGIVARHEVLRTRFGTNEGELQITIDESIHLPLTVQQCEGISEQALSFKLKSLAGIGFELDSAPLMRANAMVLGEQDFALFFCFHHIISDGWSIGVFVKELTELYQGETLAPVGLQYFDYAQWQRDPAQVEALNTQVDYWQQQLTDLPVLHNLPLDQPRPAQLTLKGALHQAVVPKALAEQFKQLADSHGATAFMAYQAAFAVLLGRFSNSEDIVVGTPIAGRTRKEVEPMLGLFVNTLVLRTDLSESVSFNQLLKQTKSMTLDAFDNQDVPFDMLVERISPARSVNHTPLFQILFTMQNNEPMASNMAGTELSLIDASNDSVKFDLSLHIGQFNGEMNTIWQYNTQLFSAQTIERFSQHYVALLQDIVDQPNTTINELEMLTIKDKAVLLNDFNHSPSHRLDAESVTALFETQASINADHTALEYQGQSLSYAQLNGKANQLAHYLVAHGVQAGSLVGICLDRTPDMLVAVLAIIKAGGAYVPLDPKYPAQRLQYIVQSSEMTTVISATTVDMKLSLADRLLLIDQLDLSACSTDNLPPVSKDNLMYVLYTSGSTGKPKGVEVTHANVLSLLGWVEQTFEAAQTARMLFSTSLNFDPSVHEIFGTLCFGHTGILVDNGLSVLETPEDFNFACTVPSVARAWVENDAFPANIQGIGLGGEILPGELVNEILSQTACAKVYNFYGPTEATVNSTFDCFDQPVDFIVPIGRPVPNSEVYVLSAQQKLLPIGAVGELYIGGDNVANGYHNRADLTAERFYDDLFGSGCGRLYRTGDLVRFESDGRLNFLGRIDEQVKVRGLRIELGEIESVLSGFESVCQVIVAIKTLGNDKRIVAYVKAAADVVDFEQLQTSLRQLASDMMPAYMVPAHFVWIEQFANLPNGKIDLKALPQPQAAAAQTLIEATTNTGIELLAVWADVLAIPAELIGLNSNFFALGGHSLLTIKLVNAIKQRFDIALPVAIIYQHATASDMLSQIENFEQGKAHGNDHNSLMVLLQDSTSTSTSTSTPAATPLFAIHPVGGDVYSYAPLLAELNLDCKVYGLQREELAQYSDISYRTIAQMAETYVTQILSVQSEGPYRILGWSMGGLIATKVEQLLRLQGKQVSYLGLIDTVDHSSQKSLLTNMGGFSELGAGGNGAQAAEAFCQVLKTDIKQQQQFDQMFKINTLTQFHPGISADYLRELVGVSVLASVQFEADYQVRNMHYYSAEQTKNTIPVEAINNVINLSESKVKRSVVVGDHHSIMLPPLVHGLAVAMTADLTDLTTGKE